MYIAVLACLATITTLRADSTQPVCYKENYIGSSLEESSVTYQDIHWEKIRKHLLRILLLFNRNRLIWVAQDIFWDTNKNYCTQMALGFPIESIKDTLVLTKKHIPNAQILSDVIYHEGLVIMSSVHPQTILPANKIDPLLHQLGIHTNLPFRKGMIENLAIFENVLTYTDQKHDLVCKANTYIWQKYQQMEEIMTKWIKLWEQVSAMESIIYNPEEVTNIMGKLYECLNIKHTEEFRSIKNDLLTKCLASQEVDMAKRDIQEVDMAKRDIQEVDMAKIDIQEI